MINAAIKYYEKAVNMCFSSSDLTLNIIVIGIDFELHGFLIESQKKEVIAHSKAMQKRWNKTEKNDCKGILQKVFGNVDFNKLDSAYYRTLGRKITY